MLFLPPFSSISSFLSQTQTEPEGRPRSEARLFQVGSVFLGIGSNTGGGGSASADSPAAVWWFRGCVYVILPAHSLTPWTSKNRSAITTYISWKHRVSINKNTQTCQHPRAVLFDMMEDDVVQRKPKTTKYWGVNFHETSHHCNVL